MALIAKSLALKQSNFRSELLRNCFKMINNGCLDNLLFLPGWGTDYEIFQNLNLPYNYILITEFNCKTFNNDLNNYLFKNNFNVINIFGWSMGGFLAIDFYNKYPESVNKVIACSIKPKYSKISIDIAKNKIVSNKSDYLLNFYSLCFFNKHTPNLLNKYINKFDVDYLLQTLDYLGELCITIEKLKIIKNLTVIHGNKDLIAPIREIKPMLTNLNVKFIEILNSGHAFFLESDNSKWINKI